MIAKEIGIRLAVEIKVVTSFCQFTFEEILNTSWKEIGLLRDPRFIIPALDSKDFNNRLCAVSCLAFLPYEDGNVKLLQLATKDIDAGVRQSALWASGFIGGEKAISFIQKQILRDKDSRVRDFAEKIVENYRNGWFNFVTGQ